MNKLLEVLWNKQANKSCNPMASRFKAKQRMIKVLITYLQL